jgi:membrane protein YqaA with SNARE-associated domain
MWLAAAAAWGFAEATLFFIVPDVLLTWLAGFRPQVAWRAVLACLGGALAGGVVMYVAATQAPESMRALLDCVPAVSGELVGRTGAALQADYGPQMLRAGFSGVPYKILAVESAAQGQGLATFLAWSVPARLSRWVFVVLFARGVAKLVRARVARADGVLWTLWAVGWGIVYVVYFRVMGW